MTNAAHPYGPGWGSCSDCGGDRELAELGADMLCEGCAMRKRFSRARLGPGPTRRKGSRKVFRSAAPDQRQEKPGRARKRDGRAPARPGNEIVAWEYRTPRSWFEKPTALLTVLDPHRSFALQYVYRLGRTTKDIACGLIDLVPIMLKETRP
jgi:hypothetical protein